MIKSARSYRMRFLRRASVSIPAAARRRRIGVAACFLLAAIANGLPANAAAVAEPPSEASSIVIPAGRVESALRALDGIARELMQKTGVPGMAIGVVHADRVVFERGFGIRRVGGHRNVDTHTVFELASLSKPVGAMVIAGAVGRGCVRWTDRVARYLPGFALSDREAGNAVTIADMYAHRSGLPDHAGDLLEDLGYDRATILRRLALEPLEPFRIIYHYTNFGLTAGAEAVAGACGKPWDELSHDILYSPLAMHATSSRFADYIGSADRADLHVRDGMLWKPRFVRDADAQSPAGGVSSSIDDMTRFIRLELGNGRYAGHQVIDEKALLDTRNPNLLSSPLATPNSRGSFYGFGIGVSYDSAGRLRLSHSGAFATGAATTIALLPSERLGIVVLTNAAPVGLPETIAADFMDLVEYGSIRFDWFGGYGRIFKNLEVNHSILSGKTRPSQPANARANDVYNGAYVSRFYGRATVAERNGSLALELGPRNMRFVLKHWSGNVFSYMPRGENALGISAVTFALEANGNRTRSMTVENLNAEKLGTFTRAAP